jgi:hypothetical protein
VVDSTAEELKLVRHSKKTKYETSKTPKMKWTNTGIFWIWRRDFNDEEGIEKTTTKI